MMKHLLMIALLVGTTVSIQAQQVANFALTNVGDGKVVSLDTYSSSAGVAIIFTSNACAFDDYYRSRIDKLSREYQDKVPVLLVNSNPDPLETVDNMTRKAQQLNLNIPYLADKDQALMKKLGASKSPQVFLLKNNGGKFSIVYRGAIDDNPQVEADVRHAYLKDAIDTLLTNQKVATPEVRPVGCTIRKK